jgi:hypothetical protein
VSSALLAYRPAPPAGPALVRRDRLDPLTWSGMVRDGTLVPVWHGVAVRAGVPVTPRLRLAALADLVPHRGVVGRVAAVWVHAGGPAPGCIDVLVRPHGRRTDPHPHRRACEAPLPAADVLDLGTGRVTTVQRTGLDVARSAPPDEARPLLVVLLGLGFEPAAALAELDRLPGERGTRRARDLLTPLTT